MPKRNPEWGGRHLGKDDLRAEIWSLLKQQGVSTHDPFDHIPSFVGADEAAERLASLPIWQHAEVVKCNPDRPQAPVRLRALRDGKRLYMAVPRLTDVRCFVELTAEDLRRRKTSLEEAAMWQGAMAHGRRVSLQEMQPSDLVVTGCVAVARSGGRTGKGAGFADLELGMLREFGLLRQNTPIVTTVHSLQIVEDSRLPMQPHDSALDWIITPDEVIETQGTGFETPRVPSEVLADYYTWLEQEHGFAFKWIRMDYTFDSLEESEKWMRFFFGDEMGERVVKNNWLVVPECAGIWWKTL